MLVSLAHAGSALAQNPSRPEAARSPRIIVASQAGARLDANFQSGGGSDDTAALQRALDRARDGLPLHLMIDGVASVSGLDVHSNTTIECLAGGGFYLRDHSDRALLRNGKRSRGEVLDHHIRIVACSFNGNREGQQKVGSFHEPGGKPYRSPRQEPDGTYKSLLQFFGAEHLSIERVTLFNSRAFGVWIANATDITLRDVQIDSNMPPFPQGLAPKEAAAFIDSIRSNTDGLHFNGPIHALTVDGLRLRTEDDGIGLNANDMGVDDMTRTNEMGPYVGQGPITDVNIRNVMFLDSLQGIRLLATNQRMDRVHIADVSGTIRHRAIIISHYYNPLRSPNLGNFGAISFDHVTLTPESFYNWRILYPQAYEAIADRPWIWDQDEEGLVPVFSINASIESLSLTNVFVRAIDDRPIIRIGRDAAIGFLRVDARVDDVDGKARFATVAGGRVRRLRLDLDWPRQGSSIGRPALEIVSGTVNEVLGQDGGKEIQFP